MTYAPQGSSPTVEGSRHAPIYVSTPFARLWESAIRYQRMVLVRPLVTFRLWRGFRRKDALLSTSWMEYGDIQRDQGGRFRSEGNDFRALRVWNLVSALLHSLAGGRGEGVSRNALLPLRYQAWQLVGNRRSLAMSVK